MPLVAAVACPHTPQLLIRPETEDRALVLRVHAAYAQVKRLLTEARTASRQHSSISEASVFVTS